LKPKSYIVINYIFAGIILAIFFYSALYSPLGNSHPIKCIHAELLGGPCPSCGLSRGFSAIMHFNITLAKEIQPNSIAVFLFFLIQLFFRLSIIFLLKKNMFSIKTISNTDIVLSTFLFFFCFRHFILQTLYIFYKMLLTGNTG
jgi:hypothetical protein